MSAHISQYLDNIISWAHLGSAAPRKNEWPKVQHATRPRTPWDLASARKRRMGRRLSGRRLRSEWRSAMSGVLTLSRPSIPSLGVRWRIASVVIVMLCGGALTHLASNSAYFVDSINLSGAALVPGDEVYSAVAVEGQNILWLDPHTLEGRIEQIPGMQEAYIEIEFPSTVNVHVVEQLPVLAWTQGGDTVWVDARGDTFPARFYVPWLLPVTVDDVDTPLESGDAILFEVVIAATQLKALRPNIELLHYDTAYGISYQDGRHWRGYFGIGDNMAEKLLVYETLVEELLRIGIHPTAIYVADLDMAYYVE